MSKTALFATGVNHVITRYRQDKHAYTAECSCGWASEVVGTAAAASRRADLHHMDTCESWLDRLTHTQKVNAYLDWRAEKKALGEDNANLTIVEWEEMERTFEERAR